MPQASVVRTNTSGRHHYKNLTHDKNKYMIQGRDEEVRLFSA
jgi:hypothetical protein